MMLLLYLAGGYLIATTILSRVRSARWWIRFCDFPRLQVATGLAAVGVGLIALGPEPTAAVLVFAGALLLSFAYNMMLILPYTPLAPCQVLKAPGDVPGQTLRILISNIKMENRGAQAVLQMVRDQKPDVFLAVETDDWWEEQLRVLEGEYPETVKRPQDNHYGMLFFSKLPIVEWELRFRVDEDVPSMRVRIRLRSGDVVSFHGIHPRPPLPDQGSELRDAELVLVGKEVVEDDMPTIVAGDLNDVAWSHTTKLFQRISGLLDPRRGRGLFSTFPARYPFLRWPLDHVFHDDSFTLVRLRCLPSIGSDHLPVLIDLQHEPAAEALQQEPQANADDREEAAGMIQNAAAARA